MTENKELFVFARNNVEMRQEQNKLIDWAESRIVKEVEERDDLSQNLEAAERACWDTGSLKRAIRRACKRVIYYDKVLAALKAGFQIVPNMDLEVFAVRTEAEKPKKNSFTSSSSWLPAPDDQVPSASPAGDGRYVRPEAEFDEKTKQLEDGKTKLTTRWASAFQDVDFPFVLARVQVLDATSKAMAHKIFDDMGVLPKRVRNADPMVIGRIGYRDGALQRHMSFVVAWFLDTSDL